MPPAAKMTTPHTCSLPGPPPHVGMPVASPCAPKILLNGNPAARVTDIAPCNGPPDGIISGAATVIVAGLPAARISDRMLHPGAVLGPGESMIQIGGPTFSMAPPAGKGGALTMAQAQAWMTMFGNMKEYIPFDFPQDGCWARASEMCRMMNEAGVPCGKTWIEASTRAALSVPNPYDPAHPIFWGWHVAPNVSVEGPSGTHDMILDPSLSNKPLTPDEWSNSMAHIGGEPHLQQTSSDVFKLHSPKDPTKYEMDPDYSKTNADLEYYRHQRDAFLAGTCPVR